MTVPLFLKAWGLLSRRAHLGEQDGETRSRRSRRVLLGEGLALRITERSRDLSLHPRGGARPQGVLGEHPEP